MPSDPTAPSAAPPGAGDAGRRPSFRRRLLVTLGVALAAVFVMLGVVVWFVAYGWLQHQAAMALRHEASEIASQIITPGGHLRAQRYAWYEPHHRFAERRIDPYFAQVFGADGTLLRASDNTRTFAPGAYPDVLLARSTLGGAFWTPLATLRVDGVLLYYDVFPVRGPDGATLGYVQLARYRPDIAATLRRVTLVLLVALGGLLAGLLVLTWRVACRVLQPLESITTATHAISPERLHRRFPVPDEADRETAQLAATLNTLMDRLEHSFEEMQRFTANAAHELQTPLTVLRGHVDVALRRERTPEAYQRTLQLLGTEIDHLSRMTRGLLALARLDRDEQIREAEPVDLADLVRGELDTFRERAAVRDVVLKADLSARAVVRGVPHLLREVVINLLDNAVKYTPAGTVSVRLDAADGQVALTVVDTGVGIAAEALPHVTDRFFREPLAHAASVPGHGLGLTLVARIVALHDGRLAIDAARDAGTTVRVTLPAAVEGRGKGKGGSGEG